MTTSRRPRPVLPRRNAYFVPGVFIYGEFPGPTFLSAAAVIPLLATGQVRPELDDLVKFARAVSTPAGRTGKVRFLLLAWPEVRIFLPDREPLRPETKMTPTTSRFPHTGFLGRLRARGLAARRLRGARVLTPVRGYRQKKERFAGAIAGLPAAHPYAFAAVWLVSKRFSKSLKPCAPRCAVMIISVYSSRPSVKGWSTLPQPQFNNSYE